MQVSIEFATLIVRPFASCRLLRSGQFTLTLPAGIVKDASSNQTWLDGLPSYRFNTIIDETPPAISATSPAAGETAVNEEQPYILRFSDDFVSPCDTADGFTVSQGKSSPGANALLCQDDFPMLSLLKVPLYTHHQIYADGFPLYTHQTSAAYV